MTTEFEAFPLSPALGVEICGLDLRTPPDPGTVDELMQVWRRHHLLLFRDQNLDEEQQIRFAELFGPISHRGDYMKGRMASYVSNTRSDGILGEGVLHFHSDHVFFRHPLKAIALFAIEVPRLGGDTLFSNSILAYRSLPPSLQARVRDARSLQLFDFSGDYNERPREENAPKEAPRAEQPVVLDDPETGEKVLFIHHHTTARILGLAAEESEALLEELLRYIGEPEIGYRHVWRSGDLVLWNNVTLQHARTAFDPSARRTLRRTPIAVSEAEAHDETAEK